MSERVLKAVMCACGIALMNGTAVADPPVRMFWVTEDGDPADFPSGTTVVFGIRGAKLCMEIWIQGLGADFVSAGAGATIDDRAAFNISGTLVADCATAGIDSSHVGTPGFPGWVTGFTLTNDCGESGMMDRVTFFRMPGFFGVVTLPASGAYFAEVCFDVPDDASGSATINYIGGPPDVLTVIGDEDGIPVLDAVFSPLTVRAVGCIDHRDCADDDVCTLDQCVTEECTNTLRAYGDVNGDGMIDLFDLFCLLDGFDGNFEVCPFHADDIEPCGGDGVIDLFDLFAILNALFGVDPCCGT